MNVAAIAGGRYSVERALGDGAMAQVVLARDGELDRLVAIKILDEQLATDESFRARFAREARLAASLSHPNLVTIFDAGTADDGSPYIVMEYVEGRTLEDRLRDEGALDPDEVRSIARQVCAGLDHAHANGMIHRDLKPGNLIQRTDGTVKIADFGIARGSHATELTEAGTIVGTAAYLAPEQAAAGDISPATDLYALGIVVYELLTGRRPWRVDTLADLGRRAHDPPTPLPAHIPGDLRDVIARCLAPDPAHRPSSAGAVVDELSGVGETETVVLRPADTRTAPPRARRASRPRRGASAWVPLALVVVVLLLGVLALGLVTGGDGENADAPEPAQTTDPAVVTIPDGQTPAEDARNLADWLRENAR